MHKWKSDFYEFKFSNIGFSCFQSKTFGKPVAWIRQQRSRDAVLLLSAECNWRRTYNRLIYLLYEWQLADGANRWANQDLQDLHKLEVYCVAQDCLMNHIVVAMSFN
jgi:hypothetical protein